MFGQPTTTTPYPNSQMFGQPQPNSIQMTFGQPNPNPGGLQNPNMFPGGNQTAFFPGQPTQNNPLQPQPNIFQPQNMYQPQMAVNPQGTIPALSNTNLRAYTTTQNQENELQIVFNNFWSAIK